MSEVVLVKSNSDEQCNLCGEYVKQWVETGLIIDDIYDEHCRICPECVNIAYYVIKKGEDL